MGKQNVPTLSHEEEIFLDEPYGGLFGDTVMARVVEELVSDPTHDFRPKYLVEMTGKSAKSVADALKKLLAIGLIEKTGDDHHPVYRVVLSSKKFAALSFLAYAMLDDRDGSDCMDAAVETYYHQNIATDFLEMPGIKKADGKMHIPGTRIYMSNSAAQKLSEAIADILKQAHSDGGMEVYRPDGE